MKIYKIILLVLFIFIDFTTSYKLRKNRIGKIVSHEINRNSGEGKILRKEGANKHNHYEQELPSPIITIKENGYQFGSQQPGSPYPTETDEPNPNGPPLYDEICHNMTSHETTQESDYEEGYPGNTSGVSEEHGTEKPNESHGEGSGSLNEISECEMTSASEDDSDSNEVNLLDSCTESRGQFSSKSSCRRFINCWDGSAYEQNCPAGLLFSEEGFCDYPYNVDCGNRSTEDSKPKSCKSPFSVYRSPNNCSEFFVCVHGCPVKLACSDQLQFDEDLGVCDYKYRVGCVDKEDTQQEDEKNMEENIQNYNRV